MTSSCPPAAHDLRPLAPPERHALAFQCFDALAEGEAFDLINDHEPRGLLLQFADLRPGAFAWQVVEVEPRAWRIRVTRVAGAAHAKAHAAQGGGCCACSCRG